MKLAGKVLSKIWGFGSANIFDSHPSQKREGWGTTT
jgi:hypothetical protein